MREPRERVCSILMATNLEYFLLVSGMAFAWGPIKAGKRQKHNARGTHGTPFSGNDERVAWVHHGQVLPSADGR